MNRTTTLWALGILLAAGQVAFGQFGGFGFGNRSVQVTKKTINGVSTTEVTEDGQNYKITEDPAEGISVEIIKTYDRTNAEEIKESHPAIYNYIEKSPQGMGPTRITVKVELAEVIQAADAEELKEKNAKAHEIYEQYAKGPAAVRIEMRGFPGGAFPGGDFPKFEFPEFPVPEDFFPPEFRDRIKIKPRRLRPAKPAPAPMEEPKVREGIET